MGLPLIIYLITSYIIAFICINILNIKDTEKNVKDITFESRIFLSLIIFLLSPFPLLLIYLIIACGDSNG